MVIEKTVDGELSTCGIEVEGELTGESIDWSHELEAPLPRVLPNRTVPLSSEFSDWDPVSYDNAFHVRPTVVEGHSQVSYYEYGEKDLTPRQVR